MRGISGPYTLGPGPCLFLEDAEDFFLAHDEEVFAVELDLGAGVLAEQDRVASLDVEGENLAFVVGLALADGDDFARLGLFLGRIGDDDAAANAFALFNAANENAVVQRCKRSSCHISYVSLWVMRCFLTPRTGT